MPQDRFKCKKQPIICFEIFLRPRAKKTIKLTFMKRNFSKISEYIYAATRKEADWSERRIVPEKWEDRDDRFKIQFVDIITRYMEEPNLPSPEEAHNSWMKSYLEMGWKYGKERNAILKTHPDLVPYNDLPLDEKEKDAIFLSFVWIVKQIL